VASPSAALRRAWMSVKTSACSSMDI
jgi:hypothetical protein